MYVCVFILQHEVIAALPKFIKLSPTLVKGVFDRLLVSYKGVFMYCTFTCIQLVKCYYIVYMPSLAPWHVHVHCIYICIVFTKPPLTSSCPPTGDQGHSISPVTPSELLIALHNIDCTNNEALMKAVIKGSTRTWPGPILITIGCSLLHG